MGIGASGAPGVAAVHRAEMGIDRALDSATILCRSTAEMRVRESREKTHPAQMRRVPVIANLLLLI